MNVPLFICVAKDTIKARSLLLSEKWAYTTQASKKGKKKNDGSKLPDMIEIALGVKVMVMINVEYG